MLIIDPIVKIPLLLLVEPRRSHGGGLCGLAQALAEAGRLGGIVDHRQDPHLALALGACQNVDFECAAEQVRLG